jgi:hypothetical protein
LVDWTVESSVVDSAACSAASWVVVRADEKAATLAGESVARWGA